MYGCGAAPASGLDHEFDDTPTGAPPGAVLKDAASRLSCVEQARTAGRRASKLSASPAGLEPVCKLRLSWSVTELRSPAAIARSCALAAP